jgi:chorismate-pyruvate lyase
MNQPPATGPELEDLFHWFPPDTDFPRYQIVPAEEVPEPFHGLLCHEHHMTVTVEKYHGDKVDVRPLAIRHRDPYYARKIVLTLRGSGKVVLFGIVRVNLDYTTTKVRAEILAGQIPFGKVLIQNNVMRRIEPTAYLHIEPGPLQLAWFGLENPEPLYGRLAYIHCDGQPAVELFEIVVG